MISRFEFILQVRTDGTMPDYDLGNRYETHIGSVRIHFNREIPKDFDWTAVNVPGSYRSRDSDYTVSSKPTVVKIFGPYVYHTESRHLDDSINCSLSTLSSGLKDIKITTEEVTSDERVFPIRSSAVEWYFKKLLHSGLLEEKDKADIQEFIKDTDKNLAMIKKEGWNQYLLLTKKSKQLREGIIAANPVGFFSENLVKTVMEYTPELIEVKPSS